MSPRFFPGRDRRTYFLPGAGFTHKAASLSTSTFQILHSFVPFSKGGVPHLSDWTPIEIARRVHHNPNSLARVPPSTKKPLNQEAGISQHFRRRSVFPLIQSKRTLQGDRRLVDTERREPLVCSAAQSRNAQARQRPSETTASASDRPGWAAAHTGLTGPTWPTSRPDTSPALESSLLGQGTCASCLLPSPYLGSILDQPTENSSPEELETFWQSTMLQKSWPTKILAGRIC